MKNRYFKKAIAILVTLALIAQMFTFGTFAAEPTIDNRVVDPATMTDWQKYFGESVLNTENAGGVWGDKSVFLNADDFNAALEDGVNDYNIDFTAKDDNFLVALSAIASNKSIVGYSAIPTDTMFVLDLSNSMSNTAMTNMINATNDAIVELNKLNKSNRIGVVVYAGTRSSYNSSDFNFNASAEILLPLGRYTGVGANNETFLNYSNDIVSVARGVLPNNATPSKEAEGATFIQAGIQLAVNEFNAVTDTVIETGPQAGTVRMPIMVLMSDGAPTAATTSFNNVGNSTLGTGNSSGTTSREAYVTQLSCAYAKNVMAQKYGRSPLFYTLGLNVGNVDFAKAVLDPANAGTPYTTYWAEYKAAQNNGSTSLTQTLRYNNRNYSFTVPVVANIESNYVDKYFLASSDDALTSAFDSIVEQIVIQSKYYPTLVDDGLHHLNGYITFQDELGPFMQVKDIKGLTVHGTLYKGSAIAQHVANGEFGNITGGNLLNLNESGQQFLTAVTSRLGCTPEQAAAVVSQALNDKQIYYTSETEYSNYLGWYADQDGNFLGYWNGKDHNSRPAGAVYANKSYGYEGLVGDENSLNKTDMLHISVQVRTHIDLDHQIVIYKIPAVLIPTVSYEINFEGDTIETGTNFTMSVNGAKEALRLIFEVGLRDDINRINVAEKIAEYEAETNTTYNYKNNGVYTFYSNSWQDHTHSNDHLVDNHDATWLEFEPSKENERYYYTYNAPIYAYNGTDYTLVTADPRNSTDTFYTRVVVFTTQSTGVSSADIRYDYVKIHEDTIKLAEQNTNGWYIPKNTVHRLLEDHEGHDFHILKQGENLATPEKEHPTKTLHYSNYPAVVFLSDGSVHADACLGNNGTFSLTQAAGIKLTKSVEVAGLGAGEEFTFDIALTAPTGVAFATSYPVYDADGIYIEDAAVTAGVITYNLTPGETVYIADLPVGTTYTVTEQAKAGWTVAQKNNDTGTVLANNFNDVEFLNIPVTHGNLMIHKDVLLPNSVGNVTYNGDFNLEVTFTSNVPFTSVYLNGSPRDLTADNKLTGLKIKDGETILISGIPADTIVKVEEIGLQSFWIPTQTSNKTNNIIEENDSLIINLTNTYNVNNVVPVNINHIGIKNLIGRDWLDTDKFSFDIEYFNGANWISMNATKDVLGTDNQKTFSFDNELQAFVFNAAGTYQFRAVEKYTEIGGVNYDHMPKRFDVVVENDFSEGKLKITSVTTNTPIDTSVANSAGVSIAFGNEEYTITTVFNNNYSVAGTANAIIDITKHLENNTGINRDLSGFEFELYQLDPQGQKINVENIGTTDATGTIRYIKSFGADLVGETLTYYIAEVDKGELGVIYDDTIHRLDIQIIDNLDGTVSANINNTNSNSINAEFNNEYKFNPATVVINGNKEMTGRPLDNSDEIYFEIYRADANFENQVKINNADAVVTDGKFKFEISEDTVGTKYYVIKEKATNLPGVTDDTSVYNLTVKVEKGTTDTLVYNIESILKNGAPVSEIIFVNQYAPTPIQFGINGEKVLTGRNIVDGEFKFVLKDENGIVLQTKEVVNGAFAFDNIEYTQKGRYLYTVEELVGEDTTVTFDNTVYKLTVEVTDDGRGTLTPTATLTVGEKQVEKIVFTNTYTAPVVPVPTPTPNPNPPMGDTANIFLWFAVAFVSGGLLMLTGRLGKRKEA